MPPYMVRQFIQRAHLKAGYHFDYINTLMMVDNWLPNFDMNEQIKMDKHIPEHLAHGHQAGEQSEVARNRFIL